MAYPFLKKKAFLFVVVFFSAIAAFWLVRVVDNRQQVDFNADIRPILNKNCLACHGGVKQSGKFSLLFRDEALKPNESGKRAIVPGKPDESEMIWRITHADPEIRMPAEKAPLAESEIKLLTRWMNKARNGRITGLM